MGNQVTIARVTYWTVSQEIFGDYGVRELLSCLSMTTILTLPPHITGFLRELGTQSGIDRSVMVTVRYPVRHLQVSYGYS